jgi:hypothetical protein
MITVAAVLTSRSGVFAATVDPPSVRSKAAGSFTRPNE